MQICGLTLEDLGILPKGPLLAFLLVQNGGYLVAFTAGGQTLGKMAAGIRVVPTESDASLDLGRAFLRDADVVLLAVPAGLGFLTALFSRDHRGLHDRFAGTRVVRARHDGRDRDLANSRVLIPIPASLAGHGVRRRLRPVAPGTFGSAAGLLLWWLLPASPGRSGARDRRAVRRRIVERQRRGAAFRPHRSRAGRHRRSDGHAHHAVPESRSDGAARRAASCCFASPTSIKPYPANRLERLHGGVGVMADDAMAAVYANLALRVASLVIW